MATTRNIDAFLQQVSEAGNKYMNKKSELFESEDGAALENFVKQTAEDYSKKVLLEISTIMSRLETDEAKQQFAGLMNHQLRIFYRNLEDSKFYSETKDVLSAMMGYYIAKEDGLNLQEYTALLSQRETFGDRGQRGRWMNRMVMQVFEPEEAAAAKQSNK